MKSTEKFMKMLKKMYLSKTEIPERKFKRLMKKDIYLTPEKCLKYKIVSELE
jgi:ATP-dependent protease ClpP protease subunit